MKEELMRRLNYLSHMIKVYSDFWGPDCQEVKNLEQEALEIDLMILDLMVA